MCDRWDIGGLSTNVHFQTGRSTIFIYDGHPGGVGITRRGYEQFERLLGDAERLIAECPCESGLPLLRAEPQVRQPQRTPAQGRRAGADGPDAGRALIGQSSRRARIAKAWDQASGVVERGTPVRASTRSGRARLGWRRGAGRRAGAAPARRSPSAARLQAVQAVGAVQGSSLRPASPGVIPKRVPGASRRCSVRRTAGKRPGCGNGRTAQAAAESSPDSGSPGSPHQSRRRLSHRRACGRSTLRSRRWRCRGKSPGSPSW